MGNCFGKSSATSSNDAFNQPGRTLGSAPTPQQTSAKVPAAVSNSPGRTLGQSTASSQDDPKTAAARAAEERAKASQGKGKLGKQLDAQKARTQADTLAQTSKDNRAARDADAAADARAYN